ncbi:MAG: oligosaccharide flippase family protein [Pirellulaceae bacterium]
MTEPQRTTRNIAIVSAASFAQIVIQFLFQRVLARIYGADAEADALAAALALPTMFAAMVTGSLGYVLVPELVARFSESAGEGAEGRGGWRIAALVGLLTSGVSLAIASLLYVCAAPICRWLYGDLNADTLQMTVQLLRILSVQVLLTGLVSWSHTVHHSRHSFLVPALAGVSGTLATLALAQLYGEENIAAVAWAINLGSVLSVAIQIWPLLPGLLQRSDMAAWSQDYPRLMRMCGLLWPLLLGAMFMRIDPVVDRVLAAQLAAEEPGAIAHINYATRIAMALLAIGTSGLSVVAFPQLAGRLEREGQAGFADHFGLAFRRLILLVVPIAIGFSIFAVWIVRDLLQQGEFTSDDTRVVAGLIVAMMGMFVGASCGDLLARGYYVLGDTKTPTLIGSASILVGLALKVSMFYWLGIWGIALSISIYLVVAAIVMAWHLARQTTEPLFSGSLTSLMQSLVGALVACGISWFVYEFGWGKTWGAAPAGALSYLGILIMIRNPDALLLVQRMRRHWVEVNRQWRTKKLKMNHRF